MEAMTMSALLEQIGIIFTQTTSWLGDLIDVIVGNPLLLLMVAGFTVVGFVVGITSRLLKV